jgi:hypothetical protein
VTALLLPRETAIDLVDELLVFARGRLAKVALPAAIRRRDALFAESQAAFSADLADYFSAMAERIAESVSKAVAISWDPDRNVDWTVEDDELETVLARWYTTFGEAAYGAVGEQLAVELRFDLNARGVKGVMDRVATEVRRINDQSRELLRSKVAEAIDRGYSVDQLVAGVADDGFAGLRELVEGWASTPDGAAGARAQTIALTETANAYNAASLAGYEDSGLVDAVEVFDGPECGWTEHDDPDLADGSTRTLDEANDYPISHPNCQRAFGPVVAR